MAAECSQKQGKKMKTIDLAPNDATGEKVTFYGTLIDESPIVIVDVSNQPQNADFKIKAHHMYPGTTQEWHQYVARATKDELIELGVVISSDDGDSINQSKYNAL
jgi:hypothetical protein